VSTRLSRLTISGFRSIRRLDRFQLDNLSVLIGANGAGKSNLISFFRALSHMMSSPAGLQSHLTATGRAHSWLHDGPGVTSSIDASLEIETEKGRNDYEFSLEYAANDRLFFNYERFRFLPSGQRPDAKVNLGSGHEESRLRERAERGEQTPSAIRNMLRKFIVHQFHNTSFSSRMRQAWPLSEGRWLKEDGGNLGSFLYRLRSDEMLAAYYARIVQTVRQCLPYFADFDLEPENGLVTLAWREIGSDQLFEAHQASDGMLRFMALVALLQQPAESLPALLILDEPELGLHPHAITTVAGLIKSASLERQVIVATQSVTLLNEFEPSEIVVVERQGRESRFRRLDAGQLEKWLEQYTVGELWEKNILGGRPTWQ
jgi:predicted ATPase